MTDINWKTEALEFSKVHDLNHSELVAVIEKAMKHGAFLLVRKELERNMPSPLPINIKPR